MLSYQIRYVSSPEKSPDSNCGVLVPLLFIGEFRFMFLDTGLCWMDAYTGGVALPEFPEAIKTASELYSEYQNICFINRMHREFFSAADNVYDIVDGLREMRITQEEAKDKVASWQWVNSCEEAWGTAHAKLMLKAYELYAYPNKGYVYLVQSVSGHYKIGRSKNVNDRIQTFNVKLPFEIELLHTILCSDYCAAERALHYQYAMKRVNGSEFFALDADDVTAIKSIVEM